MSNRSIHFSSKVYIHSKAAFLRSNPSSTSCLKGPISTSRINSLRFCVSLYNWGKTDLSKSRIRLGLLWAAELKATKATRLTLRSGSCKAPKKSPMQFFKSVSMGWGWSEMVNFMAVTTVVLINGDCEDKEFRSSGKSLSGHIRQSFPRHSATTFRVPSSLHSQCLNSCFQIAGT